MGRYKTSQRDRKDTKVFEEKTFSFNGDEVEMKARWRFIELPETVFVQTVPGAHIEVNPKEDFLSKAVGVEFLSIDFTFGGWAERCWYWFHEQQLEVLQWLYESAEQKTPNSELLEWMSGLDTNYSTTKSERKEALVALVRFNEAIIQAAKENNVSPRWGK